MSFSNRCRLSSFRIRTDDSFREVRNTQNLKCFRNKRQGKNGRPLLPISLTLYCLCSQLSFDFFSPPFFYMERVNSCSEYLTSRRPVLFIARFPPRGFPRLEGIVGDDGAKVVLASTPQLQTATRAIVHGPVIYIIA